jgi:hypothetical protein
MVLQVYQQLMNQCLDFRAANIPQHMQMMPFDRKGSPDAVAVLTQMQTVIEICMSTTK